ncbi:hypothetical protein ACP275_14G106600 [Erythranthe tilingii]
MAKKPSMGRQKIKIAKIEVKNHLQVTFSKRRSGLFKKASELCTLCGVEIVIVVFSPAGKPFSFGHPNVESLVNRFLAQNPKNPNNNNNNYSNNFLHMIEADQRNANALELNLQLSRILDEVEMEKKRGESLDNMRKENVKNYWWESPVEKLGLHELEQLRDSMEDLKRIVVSEQTTMINHVNSNFGYFHGVF